MKSESWKMHGIGKFISQAAELAHTFVQHGPRRAWRKLGLIKATW